MAARNVGVQGPLRRCHRASGCLRAFAVQYGREMDLGLHQTAEVADDAILGPGTSVWHYAQIRERVVIGEKCVIGGGVYIGPEVTVGDNTKIQNRCLIYDPARIGSGVFIGPGVILTNDVYPRAVEPDMTLKRADDWSAEGVTIHDGASIGAGSVVLAGTTIGRWALIAAGSTVIEDVPAHAMVAGTPAKFKGWVGRTGRRLIRVSAIEFRCDDTNDRFRLIGTCLHVFDD